MMIKFNKKVTPTVYVAVGAPGSGKSTWWIHGIENGIIPNDISTRINMDTIRYELTGSAGDMSKNYLVSKVADQNLKNALANKIPIIYWDNTCAKPKYRKQVIKLAKKADYKCVAIWFQTPLEVSLERNRNRDNIVPEDVIQNMYYNIQKNPPDLDEGFDDIIYVPI